MSKAYRHWNREKKLIPVMVRTYCVGNHQSERKEEHVKRKEACAKCKELTEYALFRLEKCPFKKDKGFCSYCKIHCYKPYYRVQMKEVMRYAGPRMLFSHPIFAISHVVAMLKEKRKAKKERRKNN